jgi:hypothetical protein
VLILFQVNLGTLIQSFMKASVSCHQQEDSFFVLFVQEDNFLDHFLHGSYFNCGSYISRDKKLLKRIEVDRRSLQFHVSV